MSALTLPPITASSFECSFRKMFLGQSLPSWARKLCFTNASQAVAAPASPCATASCGAGQQPPAWLPSSPPPPLPPLPAWLPAHPPPPPPPLLLPAWLPTPPPPAWLPPPSLLVPRTPPPYSEVEDLFDVTPVASPGPSYRSELYSDEDLEVYLTDDSEAAVPPSGR
ncbi:hypothetical protein GE09DRAFT_1062915 [Coniochaeta sp. 2T2.1]|nr:hypothetical protein GE09DRAFT_1062915 [Coniochaeta sp. 2T2.1]